MSHDQAFQSYGELDVTTANHVLDFELHETSLEEGRIEGGREGGKERGLKTYTSWKCGSVPESLAFE